MRALRKEGREQFKIWVEHISDHPDAAPPTQLLNDDEFSHGIPCTSEMIPKVYTNKYELAKAVLPYIEEIEAQDVSHDCWPGIWDAFALALFESICPRHSDGSWNPNRIEHYVYDPGYTVRHRHRVYGSVTLYRIGRDNLEPFFKTKPSTLGDFEEQIGSRNELAGNPVALRVLHTLYVKSEKDEIIPGYTNRKSFPGFKKKLPAPGTLRRFTAISDQLKRTYDLVGISYDGFLELLPNEFREWLDK